MAKIAIIGSGFSGISASAYLSKAGHEVHVFEKNSTAGGRARQFTTENAYVFDMGPSWYWMPDIFESFFSDFNKNLSDYYQLKLLDPSFEIVFSKEKMKVPSDYSKLLDLFENKEKGSANKLKLFMQEAAFKYEMGVKAMKSMPGLSFTELFQLDLVKSFLRLQLFSSFGKHVKNYFSHPHLIKLMEFPILFLGSSPEQTPAMYSLMNYAGLKLGTWYPQGGFGSVVKSMIKVSEEAGSSFHFNAEVKSMHFSGNKLKSIGINGEKLDFDAVIASADYQHIESLLPESHKNYSNNYWDKKSLAPSSLIYYLGVNKKLSKLEHHTLFFDEDLDQHSKEIHHNPQWPSKPLFYVCCTSKSDETTAATGHENLFVLMPMAAGLEDTEELREKYFETLISRLEVHLGETIRENIDYKKSYCINDFKNDYHSYKGNAYGLANTLKQTAQLKPKIRNKKLKNLFYCGQMTVPGPGVPPAIISGKLAASELIKQLKTKNYEASI